MNLKFSLFFDWHISFQNWTSFRSREMLTGILCSITGKYIAIVYLKNQLTVFYMIEVCLFELEILGIRRKFSIVNCTVILEELTVSYNHHCTDSIRLEMLFLFLLIPLVKLAFSWPQSEGGWILPPYSVLYLRFLYTLSKDAVDLGIRYLSSLIIDHK